MNRGYELPQLPDITEDEQPYLDFMRLYSSSNDFKELHEEILRNEALRDLFYLDLGMYESTHGPVRDLQNLILGAGHYDSELFLRFMVERLHDFSIISEYILNNPCYVHSPMEYEPVYTNAIGEEIPYGIAVMFGSISWTTSVSFLNMCRRHLPDYPTRIIDPEGFLSSIKGPYVKGTIENTTLPDESVAYAVSNFIGGFVKTDMDNLLRILIEIKRILLPGGKVVLVEKIPFCRSLLIVNNLTRLGLDVYDAGNPLFISIRRTAYEHSRGNYAVERLEYRRRQDDRVLIITK